MNRYKSIARFIPYSPYKLRPIADVIRGKSIEYALRWLLVYNNKRIVPVKKVIESAFANAQYLDKSANYSESELVISEIRIDQGPIRKYFRPGAQGRSTILRRRYCHIYVSLSKKSDRVVGKKSELKENVG